MRMVCGRFTSKRLTFVQHTWVRQQQRAFSNPRSRNSSLVTCNHQHNTIVGRRPFVLSSFLPIAGLIIGTEDNTTIVNSVLSAYGLPTLQTSSGFKSYDQFEDNFVFEYPSSWTADKAAVEVFPVPTDGDIVNAAIAEAIAPGRGQQDDRLLMPSKKRIKTSEAVFDGQKYVYISFPSETITRSGYQVSRENYVVATTSKGRVYMLSASATSDQYDKNKAALLRHIVESFRVR